MFNQIFKGKIITVIIWLISQIAKTENSCVYIIFAASYSGSEGMKIVNPVVSTV